MKRIPALISLIFCLQWLPSRAGDVPVKAPQLTDYYEISFGPQMEAIPGDPAFLVPVKVSFSQPTVRVNILLNYDPVLLTPMLLAPNMFFQSFVYDISLPGRIDMSLITDLPPPPYVSPILGDTIIAWISFRVTTRDIGYDYLTHIIFVDDPVTPYPDNFIVLQNNDIINPPVLVLNQGDVLVWHPLYGDININTYPWEIGDAVTFLNYFMGLTQFNRRQYANSDCNRDGVQATISDLVFLLRRISGDTLLAIPDLPIANSLWKPAEIAGSINELSPANKRLDVVVDNTQLLGGASFVIDFGGGLSTPRSVTLDSSASSLTLLCFQKGNQLRVTALNWNGRASTYRGGRLFTVAYDSQPNSERPQVVSADFSDNEGFPISPEYHPQFSEPSTIPEAAVNSFSISSYPNPFNNTATIRFDIPVSGRYKLAAFDMLGRKVKTLMDDYRAAGPGVVIWDGTDDFNAGVASGTYFLRLQGDTGSNVIPLTLLK